MHTRQLAMAVAIMVTLAGAVAMADDKADDEGNWTHQVPFERFAGKDGKPQSPGIAYMWISPDTKFVRGVLIGQKIILEKKIATDVDVRKAAAEEGLAIIYLDPGFDALFSYVKNPSGQKLEQILAACAKAAGRPELEFAPMITLGHSTAGIFARNIAYWKPHRVAGIIHIKSGNLHQHIVGDNKSLAGVPFVAINGELEDCGPEGGGKRGIRDEYGLQTQWVMIRKQILDRRAADADYLMSLIVHPGGTHTDWSPELSQYVALWIRQAAKHRIPAQGDGKTEVRCIELKATDGWLTDADIKAPRHKPAPYDQYTGDKSQAFWHFDQVTAEATYNFHDGKFTEADPSRDKPAPSLGEVYPAPNKTD